MAWLTKKWRAEMVRTVTAFLVAACILYAARAMAITSNEWKRLPETAQQVYVIGVVDTGTILHK